ncbi:MAG: hypothetical protein QNJ71_03895 [Acidimicrobiia bacterium]|nr:hypothetical protein [Acidimicrobiia bacterium]
MPRLSGVLLTVALIIAGCSSTGSGEERASTTTTAPTTTATPTKTPTEPPPTSGTTVATSTTTLPPLDPPEILFRMTRLEILDVSAPIMETAQTITEAMDSGDRQQLVSAFAPGSHVIDFIVPSLRPPIDAWFGVFMKMCDESQTSHVHVNVSGVTWRALCSGLYEGFVGDPPPATWFLPQVLMEESMGVVMLSRVEAEAAAAYPAGTSDAIGLPISREANVARMAAAAERFALRFEQAWESDDADSITGLYGDGGVRIDGFAGLGDDPRTTHAWIEAFVRDYDEVSIEIDLLVASAPGPGAAYTMMLGSEGDSCVIRMVSAWELDEDDHIVREYVYYDPDTVFDCSWQAPEE